MSIKKLTLSEIDQYILLLDNSVNGRDNRVHKRMDVKIPLTFMMKSATGEIKKDMDQPVNPSYFVDLSKGGAGVLTGRRLDMGEELWAMGIGDKRVFQANMKIMNVRRAGGQMRYGCKILSLKMLDPSV
jgi:hypothetical protein